MVNLSHLKSPIMSAILFSVNFCILTIFVKIILSDNKSIKFSVNLYKKEDPDQTAPSGSLNWSVLLIDKTDKGK